LSWPVLDNLWSLSYLSTKYSIIARDSLDFGQPSISGNYHSRHLPNNEIFVVVVDDRGNAAVRVYLQILRTLLFFLAEIKIHRLVCQPEFFKNNGSFPESQISFQIVRKSRREADSSSPSVRATGVGVKSKLFAMRHCRVVISQMLSMVWVIFS
jgi:hypothetical protein